MKKHGNFSNLLGEKNEEKERNTSEPKVSANKGFYKNHTK
jgi:hypothetical protein